MRLDGRGESSERSGRSSQQLQGLSVRLDGRGESSERSGRSQQLQGLSVRPCELWEMRSPTPLRWFIKDLMGGVNHLRGVGDTQQWESTRLYQSSERLDGIKDLG